MQFITRDAWIEATPEDVWARIAALDWERWDPDLETIEGAKRGFVEGGTGVFLMKNGQRFAVRFHDLDRPRSAAWTARGFGGLLTAAGLMELERGAGGTRFVYSFGMGGLVGAALMRLMRSRVRRATAECAEGLARLIRDEALAAASNPRQAVNS